MAKVALRVLGLHATSAATERIWSLWGCVFTAARSLLGLGWAKMLIALCFNDRAAIKSDDDLHLLLSVIEGDVVPDDDEEE